MQEQIRRDIQIAIDQLKTELTQLDQLRARKKEQLRQYRRALKLVGAEHENGASDSQGPAIPNRAPKQ